MSNKESYKHKSAKNVLSKWLSTDFIVHSEVSFDGFRPDLTTYKNDQIQAFYEVVHTSDITGKTIGLMQYFCYVNNLDILLHVIDAEYVLRQCEKPENIEGLVCELVTFNE